MKKYRITLTAAERDELEQLLARGKADVRKLKHAQVLLKADQAEGGPAWTDERIVAALQVGVATVQRLRQRFVEEGLQAALSPYRVDQRLYQRKLDGEQEAKLIALACSTPPVVHGRWTLRLLAKRMPTPGLAPLGPRMVELQHVATLSHETVRQTLKKRAQAASEEDVVHPAQAVG